MKVLMFGWEFPPISSGGLGTACHGLTKALSEKEIDITFVIPKGELNSIQNEHLKLIINEDNYDDNNNNNSLIKIKQIKSIIKPYINSEQYKQIRYNVLKQNKIDADIYGEHLYEEVQRYSIEAVKTVKQENFDVIHCHDWMTFPAGIKAKEATNKPFVVHVHATEYDRNPDSPNAIIYDIEKEGMMKSDKIIAVSEYTKQKIIKFYEVNSEKITVVHNAVEQKQQLNLKQQKIQKITEIEKKQKIEKRLNQKIVLFLGRLTLQKGPDYFLYAAEKVLTKNPNVLFIIAGSGDMETKIIEQAASMGIAKNIVFTGFLSGNDIDKIYSMADLYVMPSVSEPFGITPLEALRNNTPVLISRQSGVSEILQNALQVDFWDIDQMANKILAVLQYPDLYHSLRENGRKEVTRFTWQIPAEKCIDLYKRLIELHKIELNQSVL